MKEFDALLNIARRKAKFDETSNWFKGSETYLVEMKKEIDEVLEEIPKHRTCYLEDELSDVLWDYLNLLLALERESGIQVTSVITRACKKYEERISGIEAGELWSDIKLKQQAALKKELHLEK